MAENMLPFPFFGVSFSFAASSAMPLKVTESSSFAPAMIISI